MRKNLSLGEYSASKGTPIVLSTACTQHAQHSMLKRQPKSLKIVQ